MRYCAAKQEWEFAMEPTRLLEGLYLYAKTRPKDGEREERKGGKPGWMPNNANVGCCFFSFVCALSYLQAFLIDWRGNSF